MNINKCSFFQWSLVYLGVVVSQEGFQMDPKKVKVILEWTIPKNVTEVRSFYGLSSFYWSFIRNFSVIIAPIIDYVKGKKFQWIETNQCNFDFLKKKVTKVPILTLLNFNKVFEVECDVSRIGIRVVLSQEGRSTTCFNKKLNDTWARYSTYDLEFYDLVWALRFWPYYLLPKDCVLYIEAKHS